MKADILFKLADLIKKRRSSNREDSYVKSLLEDGTKKINEKVFEEALELIESTATDFPGKEEKVIHEMADLWFHTMVMLSHLDLEPNKVLEELEKRFNISGLDEKASRHN